MTKIKINIYIKPGILFSSVLKRQLILLKIRLMVFNWIIVLNIKKGHALISYNFCIKYSLNILC